ncbi:MAG: hypothetical protein HRU75_07955 [Planctomycetia bacterium]|nr:MAG: hypothetical protein HRU75_07955 [Planctomycetia bacterium]
MTTDFSQAFAGADAFGAFWSDFVKRMASGGIPSPAPAAPPSPDVLAQIRRAFFDAMSQHADQFMRSEPFLTAMKQAMEHSLALQQATNDMIRKGLSAAQIPSRADADHITLLVRGVEERLVDRLERLTARIERMESGRPTRGGAAENGKPAARRSGARRKSAK